MKILIEDNGNGYSFDISGNFVSLIEALLTISDSEIGFKISLLGTAYSMLEESPFSSLDDLIKNTHKTWLNNNEPIKHS